MKETTLSNIATTLLALVSEKPMGAYDMVGILEKTNFERWLAVSPSSIYTMVKTLEKRNLMRGEQVKQGNMPEKTIFSITAAGTAALEDNLRRCLESEDANNAAFDVGMLFVCHLQKKTVLPLLDERIARLKRDIQRNETQMHAVKQNPGIPFIGSMLVRHNRLLKEAELQLTYELIAEIEQTDSWQYFLAGNE